MPRLVGETRVYAIIEVSSDPLILPTDPSVSIALPDGSTESSPPDVVSTLVDGTDDSTQLAALYTATTGGRYIWTYSFTAGDEERKTREIYWVYYYDVYDIIRTALNKTHLQLTDREIDYQFANAAFQIMREFPEMNGYGALTGNDQLFFDTGVAYLAALLIRGYKPATIPTGNLTKIKIQTSEWQFSDRTAKNVQTTEDMMLQNAYQNLGNITVIAAHYALTKTAIPMFKLAGPSRQSIATGYRPSLFGIVANLLSEQIDFNAGILNSPIGF